MFKAFVTLNLDHVYMIYNEIYNDKDLEFTYKDLEFVEINIC